MPVVELEDVTYGFNARPAVENVSLTIDDGDFLGIVGPNGSGKTTLLKLVLGLLEPDAGRIEVFGQEGRRGVNGTRIGYVPQNPGGQQKNMPLTVREVVRMGRYPHVGFGRLGQDDTTNITRAMERVGISELASRRISRLSGGQYQRVLIARALAAGTALLALDEPTVGVDAESREAFYELLRALNDDGMTIILIDHDIGVVTAYTTKIACINRELFFHGEAVRFTESDALREAYGANQRLLDHHH